MFGLGFGEMIVLGVVLLVVVGPRELPKMLRSLGRGINKLRRMSTDLRAQSGIDDIISEEGLREELDAIRSLSKGRLLEGALNAASKPGARRPPARTRARTTAPTLDELTPPETGEPPDRAQEYPGVGCDAHGALGDDEEAPLPTELPEAPEEEDISDEAGEVLDGLPPELQDANDGLEESDDDAPDESSNDDEEEDSDESSDDVDAVGEEDPYATHEEESV